MEFLKRKIGELVKVNHHFAKALHFLGIHFGQDSERTLEEVCAERGVNPQHVRAAFEKAGTEDADAPLHAYPIELVVEYLRHSHQYFIRQRLPYIAFLIRSTPAESASHPELIADLQLVFPLFAEDFIIHIYEEEDSLFGYIHRLLAVANGRASAAKLFLEMKRRSVSHLAQEHEQPHEEVQRLEELVTQFAITPETDLGTQVILSELRSFQQELDRHSHIEDHILFPKALRLENEVRYRLGELARWN